MNEQLLAVLANKLLAGIDGKYISTVEAKDKPFNKAFRFQFTYQVSGQIKRLYFFRTGYVGSFADAYQAVLRRALGENQAEGFTLCPKCKGGRKLNIAFQGGTCFQCQGAGYTMTKEVKNALSSLIYEVV